MSKSTCTVNVTQYVDFYTDIELEDLVDGLSKDGRMELATLLGYTGSPGNPDTDRIVEAAYLRVKGSESVPQEFKDLLWFVHGRAIP